MFKRPNLEKELREKRFKTSDIKDKVVIVRSCLNVPLSEDGSIADATRIKEALPGLKEIIRSARRVIIMAHLGRPKGKDLKYSLKPVASYLADALGEPIKLLEEDYKFQFRGGIDSPRVYLLENIRFFPGEEDEDINLREKFAKEVASLGDVFINDAFPDYRESASTYGITRYLPSFLGPSFVSEVLELTKLDAPEHEYIAVLGGAKLSEKIQLLAELGKSADKILVGGALAYTFLKAKGVEIGNSLHEPKQVEIAKKIIAELGDKIILPKDHLLVTEFSKPEKEDGYTITENEQIPVGKTAVDIGPRTIQLYKQVVRDAKTILWNGPLGVWEWEGLAARGTKEIGLEISRNVSAYTILGGGDTISAIDELGLSGFDHISTGGGAMLEFLSGDNFPTLEVILDGREAPSDAVNSLVNNSTETNHSSPNVSSIDDSNSSLNDSSSSVAIVYGTGSGNAELVAEFVNEKLADRREINSIYFTRAESAVMEKVLQANTIFLICSTWNVGKLQDYFIPFYKELLENKLPDKKIAVIGLGDSKNYDIFCGAADILEDAVKKVGATQIGETLRIDGLPHQQMDFVENWLNSFAI